jgi:hypothetical protein
VGSWPGWVVVETLDLDFRFSRAASRSSTLRGRAGSGGDRPCSAITILIAGLAFGLLVGVGAAAYRLPAGSVGAARAV